jgi:hypothetical protein
VVEEVVVVGPPPTGEDDTSRSGVKGGDDDEEGAVVVVSLSGVVVMVIVLRCLAAPREDDFEVGDGGWGYCDELVMGFVMAEEVGDSGGVLPRLVVVDFRLLLLDFFLSGEECASLMSPS